MYRRIFPRPPMVACVRGVVLLLAAMLVLSHGGCPHPLPDGTGDDNGSITDPNDTGDGDNGGVDDGTDGNGTNGGDGGTDGDGDGGGGIEDGVADNGADNGTDGGTPPGGDDVAGDQTTPPTTITLQLIAQSGDAVPGQPAGTVFTTFSSPVVDADGRVAFWAQHKNGRGYGGLYVWQNGALGVVVDDDPNDVGTVPGGTPEERFGNYRVVGDYDPLDEPIAWGSAGRLLFTSRITGGTGRTALFRWRASDGDLIQVADSNMIAEGLGFTLTNAAFTVTKFGNHGVSDAGHALFYVSFIYIRSSPTQIITGDAVCTSNGLAVTPIVHSPLELVPGDFPVMHQVPDQPSGASFRSFQTYTTLSPGGRMLFQGRYTAGTGTHGVYLSIDGGQPYRVVDNRPSSSLPGLPAEARIGTADQFYDAIAISTNNHIAVETPISVAGSAHDAVILWDFSIGRWTELTVAGGTPATVLLSGVSDGGAVLALAGGTPHVVDRSSSVSIAGALSSDLAGVSLEWQASGGAINNYGHAVVPYRRAGTGTPGLGFWTARELLVLADPAVARPTADVSEISVNSRPETDRPGRSSILNDRDEAVFRVTRPGTAGQAIYIGRAQ